MTFCEINKDLCTLLEMDPPVLKSHLILSCEFFVPIFLHKHLIGGVLLKFVNIHEGRDRYKNFTRQDHVKFQHEGIYCPHEQTLNLHSKEKKKYALKGGS